MPRQPNQQREFSPDDAPVADKASIIMPIEGPVTREPEEIVQVETTLSEGYDADLAFMEEKVQIRLERTSEKFQSPWAEFTVNGRKEWLPIDKPIPVARKYLEVILRAQPTSIQTDVGDATVAQPHNIVRRYNSKRYPVSILHDPSGGRGHAWAQKVVLES